MLSEIECRALLPNQNTISEPIIQGIRRAAVFIIARNITGKLLAKLKPDDIMRVSPVIGSLLLRGDDIVWRGDYGGKVTDHPGIVTDPAEGSNIGHYRNPSIVAL
jgi:hypothetical protein